MANRTRTSSSSRDRGFRTRTQREHPREVRDDLRQAQHEYRDRKLGQAASGRGARRFSEFAASRRADSSKSRAKRIRDSRRRGSNGSQGSRGAIQFFISVIIFLIAAVNFFAVFGAYAQNVAQLNSLKNQEAALIRQKSELSNNISRWSDKAYITAQARKRLGFVYPGERSVIVQNAPDEAKPQSETDDTVTQPTTKLPWYTELLYSIESVDQAENIKGEQSQ